MNPIEGIDLGEVFGEVEKEALAEKRKEVARKVSGLVLNLQQWRYKAKELAKETEKNNKRIAKAEEKLRGIKEGKWELLEDDNQQQKGQNQAGKNQATTDNEDD